MPVRTCIAQWMVPVLERWPTEGTYIYIWREALYLLNERFFADLT